ncbi:MAG: homocysteine S-methyltransferase family protein, partial [Methylocystaceae bacterium]
MRIEVLQMQKLLAALNDRILMLDGAMGTMLQQNGLKPGECPELFGIENPGLLEGLHRLYIEAGSDIIQTNTFGGNRFKLSEYGLESRAAEINTAAVKIARQAVGSQGWVAASIGPSGQLLKPMGQVDFDQLYLAFKEQIGAVADAGADIISIETMTDIGELRAAVIAAHDVCDLPVLAHLTFEEGGRTMMGTDPVTAAIILEALSPLAMGANCSGGAEELLPLIAQMSKHTNCYISVEPNAGLPKLIDGQTVFPDSPDMMAQWALRLREAGANIIGGCCGSTPEHIRAMAQMLKGLPPVKRVGIKQRALASRTATVFIDQGNLKFIGERINPTARKKLAADIKTGQMGMVVEEARKQVAAGAPILDVNMGVPGIDEPATMARAVELVQSAVTVPLALDTTNPAALEAGLKTFVGRALINSTTGESKALAIILPLAKKYGAAVLGLCLDESGIPDDAAGRMEIARKIYHRAKDYGLRDEDIYLDGLVKTDSAEQGQVMETLKTITAIKEELGVGTVLGVSNVSHGLPARELLNSAYWAMAWAAGLDLPIMNPFDERMQEVTRSAGVLLNRDAYAASF